MPAVVEDPEAKVVFALAPAPAGLAAVPPGVEVPEAARRALPPLSTPSISSAKARLLVCRCRSAAAFVAWLELASPVGLVQVVDRVLWST